MLLVPQITCGDHVTHANELALVRARMIFTYFKSKVNKGSFPVKEGQDFKLFQMAKITV